MGSGFPELQEKKRIENDLEAKNFCSDENFHSSPPNIKSPVDDLNQLNYMFIRMIWDNFQSNWVGFLCVYRPKKKKKNINLPGLFEWVSGCLINGMKNSSSITDIEPFFFLSWFENFSHKITPTWSICLTKYGDWPGHTENFVFFCRIHSFSRP